MCMIRSNGKEMRNLQSKASVKSCHAYFDFLRGGCGLWWWDVGMTPSVKHLPWNREGLSLNTKTYIKMASVVVRAKPRTGWQRLVDSWVCLTGHDSLAGEVQGSGRHCHQRRGRWNSLRKSIWGWLQAPTHKSAHGSVHIDMCALCTHEQILVITLKKKYRKRYSGAGLNSVWKLRCIETSKE